MAILFFTF